jgi:hypothetical protein
MYNFELVFYQLTVPSYLHLHGSCFRFLMKDLRWILTLHYILIGKFIIKKYVLVIRQCFHYFQQLKSLKQKVRLLLKKIPTKISSLNLKVDELDQSMFLINHKEFMQS